ncbi:MAG TPA: S9 family peptidase [Draconibacterium sp.]|nr:S9 family peptidase [Draconibacterium sp.]
MKNLFILFTLAGIVLSACTTNEKIVPPVAKKIPKELTIHGDTRIDNYYWMSDRDNPEVIAHLEAENAYTDAVMKHTEPLQEKLFEEIKSKIKQEDESLPYRDNGYYYYTRTIPETEYYLSCRKKGTLDAPEEIMLDVNKMSEGFDFFSVTGSMVSPDNKIIAYGVDTVSRRQYTVYFKNLETGEILGDIIPNTTGRITWANDNKTVFYILKDEVTLRSERIMKHTLGTPVDSDIEVYNEKDETFNTYIYKTKSNKYLIIASLSTLTSEFRFLDADNPNGSFKIVQPRIRGLEYSIDHYGDFFYIRTNQNAQNFKLVKTPVSKTEIENWVEVIPHRNEVFLEDFDLFKNFLVVTERKEGISQLRIMPWSGDEYYIDFDEEVYAVYPNVNMEFDSDNYRYSYTSLTTPNSIFDFNVVSKKRTLMKQTEVLGGFNKNDYETKRIYATAMDGTKIPMTIVYRKGMAKDGNNPALIYGYGSYGATMDPSFRLSILPLLDRGFVYAIAHIRGGQINGRAWYEDGKLLNKMNTFTDFNDCAQFLIDEKYTNNQKLFAMGGSAGGLLMGACINLKPGLYKGVVAAVPFVDVVTTMLDESIPLTTGEFDEWGNPKEEKYYYYMKSYSPYDNVDAKEYPALMVTTGLHDSQVQYFEPAKWVAKLREMKTDKNPLIFRINMDYGHGGASGRFEWIKETALEYAFIFDQIGINN